METSVKERIFYIDELRAIAILAVLFSHAPQFYPHPLDLHHIEILGLIGVPLFFMISGALLLNRDYSIGLFLKKRFSRILYPFFFWISITLLLGFFVFNIDINSSIEILFGINKYTWFIYALIAIYLSIPVLRPFIKKYGQQGLIYYLIIWLITIVLNTLNIEIFPSLQLIYFTGFLGYCILGCLLANYEFKLNKKGLIILSLLVFICFAAIRYYFECKSIHLLGGNYLNVLVVLMSASIFLFFRSVSEYHLEFSKSTIFTKLRELYEKMINSLSLLSYSIYFTHIIVLLFLATLPIYSYKLFFILTIILSWMLSFVVSKIPIINKISGI